MSNMKIIKSSELLSKAEKLIPTQTQTLSKGPTQFVLGVSPNYLSHGQGSHVWDVDGNEYIDYPLALGPITLGYNNEVVNMAITEQLKKGITFSLMNPLEVELAEILNKNIPCAEMIRFMKNGSDVNSAAIRIARAFTGREKIASYGYHGAHDWFIASTDRNRGIPKAMSGYIKKFKYNDVVSLEKIFAENKGEIACVNMEPVGVEEPKGSFLKDVKKLCEENGALLVFDEVVTGFRLALGGAQEYFGIKPDLACVGKGMANGMPISAVVGRGDVMKDTEDTFLSTTFGGECLSLAAAIATIGEMKKHNVIKHFWDYGTKLKDAYNQLAKQYSLETECIGYGPHTVFVFKYEGQPSLLMKSLFIQETNTRGILFSGTQNICAAHSNADLQKTIEVTEEAFKLMKQAVDSGAPEKFLRGRMLSPVFRDP